MRRQFRATLGLVAAATLLLGSTAQSSAGTESSGKGRWESIEGPSRFYHTATLLKSGKVLVAGGCKELEKDSCRKATADSVLFDPANGRWAPTGKMTGPRAVHAAVMLPDGKVLAAGGCAVRELQCIQPVGSAEIYDPATGRWRATAKPGGFSGPFAPEPIAPSAVAFPAGGDRCGGKCGKALVVSTGVALFTAQMFDPEGNRWETATLPPSQDSPIYPVSTLLADGRVLVHGAGIPLGFGQPAERANSVVFHPATDRWSRAGGAPLINRAFHTATLLRDGSVLAAGGFNSAPELTSETFLPSLSPEAPGEEPGGVWKAAGPLGHPRLGHAAALLPDGKVLIAGGREKAGESLASSEVYDPAARSWAPAPAMKTARGGQMTGGGAPKEQDALRRDTSASLTMTRLKDGRVLAVGGGEGKTAEIYGTADQASGTTGVNDRVRAKGIRDRMTPMTIGGTAAALAILVAVAVVMAKRRKAA